MRGASGVLFLCIFWQNTPILSTRSLPGAADSNRSAHSAGPRRWCAGRLSLFRLVVWLVCYVLVGRFACRVLFLSPSLLFFSFFFSSSLLLFFSSSLHLLFFSSVPLLLLSSPLLLFFSSTLLLLFLSPALLLFFSCCRLFSLFFPSSVLLFCSSRFLMCSGALGDPF